MILLAGPSSQGEAASASAAMLSAPYYLRCNHTTMTHVEGGGGCLYLSIPFACCSAMESIEGDEQGQCGQTRLTLYRTRVG